MTNKYEYDVAVSFAGEDRDIAEKLASTLRERGLKVFYDVYERAKMWGENLYEHLTDVYANKARYCIMLVSQYYAEKVWTNLERQSAQARALRETEAYILPVRLDDTLIPGLLETIRYEDLRTSSVEQIADLVEQKLGKTPMKDGSTINVSDKQYSSRRNFNVSLPNIPRRVTQRDRDRFLQESFNIIRQYFQQALSTLERQYPEVDTDIMEINKLKIICKIYFHGDIKSQCKIWLGSFSKTESICYSEGRIEIDRDTSMNDWISVVENEGVLYLAPSGMNVYSTRSQNDMTQEEAAAYLWERFTAYLDR